MKNLIRWVTLAALVCAAAPAAGAQVPPPVTHVTAEGRAVATLDSLAQVTRTQRIETAGCAVGYRVSGDTLTLTEVVGAKTIVSADSSSIHTSGPIGGPGVPCLHSHLQMNGYKWWMPSEPDEQSSFNHGTWELILVVSERSWGILVY